MTLRKLALTISVLCLALLLFGCGKPDIYQEYVDAESKNASLTSMEGKIEANIAMDTEGLSMTIPMTMQIKAKMEDGKATEMLMDTSTSMMGQDIKASIYYVDGMAYYDSMGTKYKAAMTVDELGGNAMTLPDFTKDMLKEAVRTAKNGEINVTATFDGNQFKEALLNMLPSDSMDLPNTLDQVSLSDVQLSYTINKDGYLSAMSMSFTMDMQEETTNTPVSAKVDMDINYVNLGQDITIIAPNLDEYQDGLDMGDFGDLEDFEGLEDLEDLAA